MKKTSIVTTIYCLTIKFLTPTRIRYIKANQATAWQCHIQSLQLSKQAIAESNEVITRDVLAIERDRSRITLDSLDPREDYPKLEPIKRTIEVQISGKGRVTQIGSLLNTNQKGEMERFLKGNFDVFF